MRLFTPVILLLLSAAGVLAVQQPFDDAPSSESSMHPHPHPQQQHTPPSGDREERSLLLVSKEAYGRLEHFAKYACAAYQFLCPHPLGNTLVQSVRLLFILSFCVSSPLLSSPPPFGACGRKQNSEGLTSLSPLPLPLFRCSSRMYSRGRMGSSRATIDAARSSLRFGGATSSRTWSLV